MADPAHAAVLEAANCESMSFRSMGSRISIQVATNGSAPRDTAAAMDAALEQFRIIDRECTRFSDDSPLMRANADRLTWSVVGEACFDAIHAAYRAYIATQGRFDPRIHDDLVRLGYDRSMQAGGISVRSSEVLTARPDLGAWQPRFDERRRRVRIGAHAIDLGGIGKGLAVRRAAQQLDRTCASFLIDAGGDCWCQGHAPDGERWRLGVDDPHGGEGPLAVLAVADAGVATSSTRLARWSIGDRTVHHLIDPSTGQPGGAGLAAVTVMADDTATAEVWSKALFLEGWKEIRAAAGRHGIAAMWVEESGSLHVSPQLADSVVWTRP